MDAPVALFTVPIDSVANVSAETPSSVQVHVHKPELAGLGGVIGVFRVVTSEGWRPHAQGLDPYCRICILSTTRKVGCHVAGASDSDPLPR